MDGLLVIDKPAGITSHDVVNRIRRILDIRRVGHTGTLDPFATGVMVILVGRATRLAQFLDKDEKEYEATVQFGFETDTGDVTGIAKSNVQCPGSISRGDIEAVLPRFIGEIDQVPPMYSAKKVGGRKLYESARKGLAVERKPAKVTIRKLDLVEARGADTGTCVIRVVCSAGTYIRSLAEEIGRAIGVGAHLSQLRRTRSGRFALAEATTLDDLATMNDPVSALLPMQRAVEHLPEFVLVDDRVDKTRHGMSTRVCDPDFDENESVRMMSAAGGLIAIGVFSQSESQVRPTVVLV